MPKLNSDQDMAKKQKGRKYKIDTRKWPGVYGYDSGKRTVREGKPDVCYYIAYRAERLRWEKIGWKSEGYTPPNSFGKAFGET